MTSSTLANFPQVHSYQRNLSLRSTQYASAELAPALSRCIMETLRGMRSTIFFKNLVSPEVYQLLERRSQLARRIHGNLRPATNCFRITATRCCVVHDAAVEVTSVVEERIRSRCLAFRLELKRSGWKIVALEIG